MTSAPPLTFTTGRPARPMTLSRVRVSRFGLHHHHPSAQIQVDPEARRLVVAVVRLAVEAMSGRRPLTQLHRVMGAEAVSALPAWQRRINWQTVRLASIHIDAPSAITLEANVRLEANERSVAATIRLIRSRGGWACTHFGLIGPGPIA